MNATDASLQVSNSPTFGRPHPRGSDPYRAIAIGWGLLVIATLPAVLWLVTLSFPAPAQDPILVAAEHFGVEPETYADGRRTFLAVCATCHGSWGQGIAKLGKPLRNSEFVQQSSDADLTALIANGRLADDPASSSGVPMPARGGSPMVTDAAIPGLLAYLRTMQDTKAPFRDVSAWFVPLEERQAVLAAAEAEAAASGLDLTLPGRPLFINSCSSCHGPDGKGMPDLGKPFTTSAFVGSKTNQELMNFVKTGRPIWDPANTTGVDMPPKGGNPALSDDDLKLIIEYVRAIHDNAGG